MKLENNWRHKTLENLEKEVWETPDPTTNTGLVLYISALRKVPLSEFSLYDMQRMISQQFSLKYLIPLAIPVLRENLFAEALYEGDLLESVLRVRAEFWRQNKELWKEVVQLIKGREAEMKENGIDATEFYGAGE